MAEAGTAAEPRPKLERDRANGMVAGVLAGFARWLGLDVRLIRAAFVILALATKGGIVAGYLLAWIFMHAGPETPTATPTEARLRTAIRAGAANWKVAAGVGFLTLALLLVLRDIGIWWSDAAGWPLILATAGAALLWRQSRAMQPGPDEIEPARTASEALRAEPERARLRRRGGVEDLYRGVFGVMLVLGAGLLFLYANGALGDARDVVLAIVVASLALGLILAPFLWRLGRNLAAERSERIRSQERAEVAAHLHDSVLQTLTLVQKRADDPREVAQLARRQERELRDWLFESERGDAGDSLAEALRAAAVEVEEAHRVPVEVIAVGDTPLTERGDALVAAAREAIVNAAKFAPDAGEIAVYAELGDGRAQVFVRDRGEGFDPDSIPAGRQGVRESIIGRMERAGGRAVVRSAAGTGTEVELSIEMEEE